MRSFLKLNNEKKIVLVGDQKFYQYFRVNSIWTRPTKNLLLRKISISSAEYLIEN